MFQAVEGEPSFREVMDRRKALNAINYAEQPVGILGKIESR
jgi:hypothetical protein